MSANDQTKEDASTGDVTDEGVTTVIGPDAVLQGDLETALGVRLEGLLEGSIRTSGRIVVTGSGEARGEIEGGDIEIHGHIDGEVRARDRLRLATSCRVEGRVVAGAVRIDDGASLSIAIEAGNGQASRPRDKPGAKLPGGNRHE